MTLYQSGTLKINGGTIAPYTTPFNVDVVKSRFSLINEVSGLVLPANIPLLRDATKGLCLNFNGNNSFSITGWNDSLLNSDFTFEIWYLFRSTRRHDLLQLGTFIISLDSDGTVYVYVGGSWKYFTRRGTINNWNHLAVQRSGGTYSIYLNGDLKSVSIAAASYSPQYTIGVAYASSFAIDGLLQMQFSPTAKYSTNFIPENFDLNSNLNSDEIYTVLVWE